ncbi:CLUMA_CG009160, isoform A [Clunio marinus]|uniref:CLUMA_CG009160, isoform A n=1 Tax=Clunio marinus TaxID=568069 RepID=A0A1J1I9Q9_9DIPT|nr:CLUMA_CG009160, isoform A [Clunio marinus]
MFRDCVHGEKSYDERSLAAYEFKIFLLRYCSRKKFEKHRFTPCYTNCGVPQMAPLNFVNIEILNDYALLKTFTLGKALQSLKVPF